MHANGSQKSSWIEIAIPDVLKVWCTCIVSLSMHANDSQKSS